MCENVCKNVCKCDVKRIVYLIGIGENINYAEIVLYLEFYSKCGRSTDKKRNFIHKKVRNMTSKLLKYCLILSKVLIIYK